jgi:hypothetical protein
MAGPPMSEHASHFKLRMGRNIVHSPLLVKTALTVKHCTAWRPIYLLARSLFRPLDQSQAL